MIVKVASRRPKTRSSFGRLARYIADAPRDGEKVLSMTLHNVHAIDLPDAISEITATQTRNQSASADKTYHLIVSFPVGERPDNNVISDIESTLVTSIGLQKHQRISAVHDDTSHLHLHIAINTVEPTTGRVVTPFRDYVLLSKAARALERKHGLQALDAIQDKDVDGLSAKARDMEAHSHLISFQRWAIATLKEPVRRVLAEPDVSWSTIHSMLGQHGLVLRPRGRGFVVMTPDAALKIKPSQIDREFSRTQLEKRLGPFERGPRLPESQCPYKALPLADAPSLYAKYVIERRHQSVARAEALAELDKSRRYAFRNLSQQVSTRYTAVRHDPMLRYRQKRDVRKQLLRRRQEAFAELSQQFSAKRQQIVQAHRVASWTAFLVARAQNGDLEALRALRHRKAKYPPSGNVIIKHRGSVDPLSDESLIRHVHKNGDITLQGNDIRLVVGEQSVHSLDPSDASIEAAVRVAGAGLASVQGSDAFVTQIERTAQRARVDQEKAR